MPSRASTPPKHPDDVGKLFTEDGTKQEDTDHVGARTPDSDAADDDTKKPPLRGKPDAAHEHDGKLIK